MAKLLLDKVRQSLTITHTGGPRAERLEVIADQLVQRRLLRLAGPIG